MLKKSNAKKNQMLKNSNTKKLECEKLEFINLFNIYNF